MRHFIHVVGRPTNRLARRLRTARPGSVLILVVALLVLMALIGTAWLTTARTDRQTSQQNAENVRLELLVQSAAKLAESTLVDDVVSATRFRPRPGSRPLDYEHYDAPSRDLHLASRVPVLIGSPGVPAWEYISGAPTLSGFESPYSLDANDNPLAAPAPHRYQVRVPNALVNAVPTYIDVPTPAGGTQRYPALGFPTVFVDGLGTVNNVRFLAADADKDGIADSALFRLPFSDGSGLTYYGAMRIIDNNSAVNAAVAWQPNVASADSDDPPHRPAGQFFPTNVDLFGLLRGSDAQRQAQVDGLSRFRLSASPADDTNVGTVPFAALFPVVNDTGPEGVPENDNPPVVGPVNQSQFLFAGEALWRKLGTRPGNPGYNGTVTTDWQYKNLSIGESMSLGFKFTLLNRLSSPSILESADRLGFSVYDTALNTPYLPEEAMLRANGDPGWYPQNFAATNGDRPRRAVLVSRNAVSNASPSQFVDMGEWRAGFTYQFGQRVRWTPTTGSDADDNVQRSYVCIRANGGDVFGGTVAPPGSTVAEGIWEPMPWHNEPTRTNINTATFGQLWTAYWAVMNAGTATYPAGPAVAQPADQYPGPEYVGGAAPFPQGDNDNNPNTSPTGGTAAKYLRKQFRSPLRDPITDPTQQRTYLEAPSAVTYQIAPYEVMRLRAALAAVNAIDIRDPDDDVTSRRITLRAFAYPAGDPNAAGAIPVEDEVDVTVFGNEAQPFITEVYATNDEQPPLDTSPPLEPAGAATPMANPDGYVAIELYNPTDQAITLTNWNIGIIDRRRALPAGTPPPEYPYPDMAIRPLTGWAGFGTTDPPTIPAGGYLVIESYSNGTPGNRPLSTGLPVTGDLADTPTVSYATVPNLHEVLRRQPVNPLYPGGELVLLRPRAASGALSDVLDPADPAAASGQNPMDVNNPYYEANADNPPAAPAAGVISPQAKSMSTMVPVDSFDFTEFSQAEADAYRVWHYARQGGRWRSVYPGRWDARHPWETDPEKPYRQEGLNMADFSPTGTNPTDPWADKAAQPVPITLGAQNTKQSFYGERDPVAPPNPDDPPPDPDNPPPDDPAAEHPTATPFLPIQLNHKWFGGFNKPFTGEAPWVYPYGGFARNGDMLQVPFIGAYTIRRKVPDGASQAVKDAMAGRFLEMNPITMDVLFAHDGDTDYQEVGEDANEDAGSNDYDEFVGRFCPLPGDMSDVAGQSKGYAWAMDLFDHLTVESPQDDHLPAVDPFSYPGDPPQGVNGFTSVQPASVTYGRVLGPPGATAPTGRMIQASSNLIRQDVSGVLQDRFYVGCRIRFLTGPAKGNQRVITRYEADTREIEWEADPQPPLKPQAALEDVLGNAVTPVAGDLFQILGRSEDALGVEGLVNVNTAPLEVLASVPMFDVPPDVSPAQKAAILTANRDLAQAIITHRNTVGPFRTLFDLNNVQGTVPFKERMGDPVTADHGDGQGDYTPYDDSDPAPTPAPPETDTIVDDFESHFLMMTRVSNLLTTRSDTFTVYVEVQGVRGVGSGSPELVVQRREAFIADRNPLNQENRVMTTVDLAND